MGGKADSCPSFRSYREFWPHYLSEHSLESTRKLHFLGTVSFIAIIVGAIVTGSARLAVAGPLSGYFFAWTAHFFVERNKPLTFKYPVWSLVSDFRMFGLWIGGELPAELKRYLWGYLLRTYDMNPV